MADWLLASVTFTWKVMAGTAPYHELLGPDEHVLATVGIPLSVPEVDNSKPGSGPLPTKPYVYGGVPAVALNE
jgi:hypothetical protein